MPAKFVNLIQFFEFKILPELEMVRFIGGSLYRNAVVPGIYPIDIAPDKEFLLRQIGYADTGMVDGQVFFREELFFQVKKIKIGGTQNHMHGAEQPGFFQQEGDADAQEEEELHQAEEEIHFGHRFEDIGARKHQYQDVRRYQQEATEIKIIGVMREGMGECMKKDKARSS